MKYKNILKASILYRKIKENIEKNKKLMDMFHIKIGIYDLISYREYLIRNQQDVLKKKIESLEKSKYKEFLILNPKLILLKYLEKLLK